MTHPNPSLVKLVRGRVYLWLPEEVDRFHPKSPSGRSGTFNESVANDRIRSLQLAHLDGSQRRIYLEEGWVALADLLQKIGLFVLASRPLSEKRRDRGMREPPG